MDLGGFWAPFWELFGLEIASVWSLEAVWGRKYDFSKYLVLLNQNHCFWVRRVPTGDQIEPKTVSKPAPNTRIANIQKCNWFCAQKGSNMEPKWSTTRTQNQPNNKSENMVPRTFAAEVGGGRRRSTGGWRIEGRREWRCWEEAKLRERSLRRFEEAWISDARCPEDTADLQACASAADLFNWIYDFVCFDWTPSIRLLSLTVSSVCHVQSSLTVSNDIDARYRV